jgi:hypothetical protein
MNPALLWLGLVMFAALPSVSIASMIRNEGLGERICREAITSANASSDVPFSEWALGHRSSVIGGSYAGGLLSQQCSAATDRQRFAAQCE